MVAGVYVTAAWDWADIQCLSYAERLAQTYYNRMAKMSRVEIDDLVSSALQGLHEAIGTFEPRRREARVSTHISWQIRYRMNEERSRSHWKLQKPPESLEREYMAGRLQGVDLENYLDTYVRSWSIPGDDSPTHTWRDGPTGSERL